MLAVYRLAAHVPVPGVNQAPLRQLVEGNQLLGLLSLFSGGSLETFSVAALGVYPYITATIVMQILQPRDPPPGGAAPRKARPGARASPSTPAS